MSEAADTFRASLTPRPPTIDEILEEQAEGDPDLAEAISDALHDRTVAAPDLAREFNRLGYQAITANWVYRWRSSNVAR